MITASERFGRSARRNIPAVLVRLIKLGCLIILFSGIPHEVSAVGVTGMYLTKVKFEYQYSDYLRYVYPFVENDDSVRYEYFDPYIVNFPENRTLAKVTQLFGPTTSLEVRYEYSGLTPEKAQNRYFLRFDREVIDMTTLYASIQNLSVAYDSPDSSSSGGNMVSLGIKHDRSGWIKAEFSLSYDNSRASNDLLTTTIIPMAYIRWSLNPVTAISGRWDGYWAENDSLGSVPAHAATVFISRYFPTQTAVHLFSRFYTNDMGIESVAPAIEIAQYIRWNVTLRLTYRFYRNRFEDEALPNLVRGKSINSHSVRGYLEWQVNPDLKLHFKVRGYRSNQDIRMNTYLFGFEYEL